MIDVTKLSSDDTDMRNVAKAVCLWVITTEGIGQVMGMRPGF
jgi:hypothetical protein